MDTEQSEGELRAGALGGQGLTAASQDLQTREATQGTAACRGRDAGPLLQGACCSLGGVACPVLSGTDEARLGKSLSSECSGSERLVLSVPASPLPTDGRKTAIPCPARVPSPPVRCVGPSEGRKRSLALLPGQGFGVQRGEWLICGQTRVWPTSERRG